MSPTSEDGAMGFVIRRTRGIDALHTERQLCVYIRFLERKVTRLQKQCGIDRWPAEGFETPDFHGMTTRDHRRAAPR